MSLTQTHKMEPDRFLTMAVNILHRTFIDGSRNDAKRSFREISAGKQVHLVRVKMEDESELIIDIALDSSEFIGKLNFAAFKHILQVMLVKISKQLQEDPGQLNIFTDTESGNMIFHLPGVMVDGENINIMVLGVNKGAPGSVILMLQFIDSKQFVPQAQAGSAQKDLP